MPHTYKKSIFAAAYFPTISPIKGMHIFTANSGVKYKDRDDLLCVHFDDNAVTAGVFTQSSMPSAPVDWSRAAVNKAATTKFLIVNAGNANAFTGKAGLECCLDVGHIIADKMQIQPQQVFQASTGVIGEPLDGKKLAESALNATQPSSFEDAAKAIMTTDTFAKAATTSIEISGETIHISGIAKGSGMIAPNMGTMLAFIFTDARIDQPVLQKLVTEVTQESFNAITVDSDTSTSDTFGVFATAQTQTQIKTDSDITLFKQALMQISTDLALQIVKDGEGLSKFITIHVKEALDNQSARKIGLSIANSPLVKTAIAGEDPNWGRIIAAIGKSGEPADRDLTSVSIGDTIIAKNGAVIEHYNEAPVAAYMQSSEISITVSVGINQGQATVYTSDLTHDYIAINADYRS